MPKHSASVAARSSIFLLDVVAIAACSGPTAAPSGSPPAGSANPSPSGSPGPSGDSTGAIEHPTGPTDVVLRLEEGGGFVPMEFAASQAPTFTLYGNGVIVFRRSIQTFPEPDAAGIARAAPWRTATLDESQVQELLGYALGPGGLGAARAKYHNDMVADASTSTFTVRAGGLDKTVAVYALFEEELQPGPDSAARKAFFQLAQRLRDFDKGGSISSDVYQPERYRGVLIEREAGGPVKPMAWPWPTLKPVDFVPGAGDGTGGIAFPHRTMSTDEVAALSLGDVPGGAQGIVLAGPEGTFYSFILRPLLADEKS